MDMIDIVVLCEFGWCELVLLIGCFVFVDGLYLIVVLGLMLYWYMWLVDFGCGVLCVVLVIVV